MKRKLLLILSAVLFATGLAVPDGAQLRERPLPMVPATPLSCESLTQTDPLDGWYAMLEACGVVGLQQGCVRPAAVSLLSESAAAGFSVLSRGELPAAIFACIEGSARPSCRPVVRESLYALRRIIV